MRSTRLAPITGATLRQPCWRSWTRNRTPSFGITTSACPTICRGFFSLPPPTSSIRSNRRSWIAWRLSNFPATPPKRSCRSPAGTWCPGSAAPAGLKASQLRITDAAIRRVVRDYTREAGLRNLERELATICRRVAVRVARGDDQRVIVGRDRVETYLGPRKHFSEEMLQTSRIGVATGLAWTAAGGDLLFIEAVAVPGTGRLVLTGRLGEVMRESAQAALSFARVHCAAELADDYFACHDIHIHVPAGSIPKDGPSAGITIAAALISQLTGRPIDRYCAMTGEITLRGDILPIGGLKEKLLAARQAGIRRLLLPRLNRRDLAEIPQALRDDLDFTFVDAMEQVVEAVLESPIAGRRGSN